MTPNAPRALLTLPPLSLVIAAQPRSPAKRPSPHAWRRTDLPERLGMRQANGPRRVRPRTRDPAHGSAPPARR
eukprot:11186004-Lingulodinium_polyedra.AAC.1